MGSSAEGDLGRHKRLPNQDHNTYRNTQHMMRSSIRHSFGAETVPTGTGRGGAPGASRRAAAEMLVPMTMTSPPIHSHGPKLSNTLKVATPRFK
jgi:hypothetical protein